MVSAAGAAAQLMAKEGNYADDEAASAEMRLVASTVARRSRSRNRHENEQLGKAGKKRGMGKKPHVRGVVMSPRDHPHGGGEAKSPVGRKKGPVDRWGNKARGTRTRHNKRSDGFIVRRRHAAKKRAKG